MVLVLTVSVTSVPAMIYPLTKRGKTNIPTRLRTTTCAVFKINCTRTCGWLVIVLSRDDPNRGSSISCVKTVCPANHRHIIVIGKRGCEIDGVTCKTVPSHATDVKRGTNDLFHSVVVDPCPCQLTNFSATRILESRGRIGGRGFDCGNCGEIGRAHV